MKSAHTVSVRERGAFALLFVLISAFALRPLPLDLRSAIPAGSDPPHHLYILDWLLDHGLSAERFEGEMFHPAKNAVLRSDLSLGTVILVAPLARLIDDPLIRFNLATWIAVAFSGLTFGLLGVRLSGSSVGGVVSGISAVMGSHVALHAGHLNLLSCGWIAVFVSSLLELLERPRPGVAVLAGVSFALTATSSGYYGVALVIVAPVLFASRASWRAARLGVLAALVALILLLPYVRAFSRLGGNENVVRTESEVLRGSLTFDDLGSRTLLHRSWIPGRGEPLFPGFGVLALSLIAIAGAARRRDRTVLGIAGAIVLLTWLALGPPGYLYRALTAVPPFGSMRHPVTLAAVGLMLLSALAAHGLSSVRKRSRSAGFALAILVVAETVSPAIPMAPVAPGVPPIYDVVLARDPGPILDGAPLDHVPLIWAARRSFETVNGGGAFIPPLTLRIHTNVQNHWIRDSFQPIDESKAARALLNETATRYVIVPAGRVGSLRPLVARFDESSCFRRIGAGLGDVAYEAVRDQSCPAFGSPREVPVP